jgi:hypothetical protein
MGIRLFLGIGVRREKDAEFHVSSALACWLRS